jgi:hypothetical protein
LSAFLRQARHCQLFLDWGGTLAVDPKEQKEDEMRGLIKLPMLWSGRFQDLRKKLKDAMTKKVMGTAGRDDQTSHIGKQKTAAAAVTDAIVKVPRALLARGAANHRCHLTGPNKCNNDIRCIK